MKNLLTRPVRKYIYAVSVAAIALMIYAGWIEPQAAPVALPLIMALLNLTPDEVATSDTK
jgi:hypothetical protein